MEDEKIERLRQLAKEAELDASQSKLVINEHCSNLRYEVILTTESAIEHINQLSEELLEQIDAYEQELMSSLDQRNENCSEDLDALLKRTDELVSELETLKTKLDSGASELEAVERKYEDLCKKLKDFKEEMFRKNFGGKYLRFIENISFAEARDHLGTLDNVKSPRTQTATKAFSNHTRSLCNLAVTSKGQLASASTDGKIRLWNAESSKMIAEINAHFGVITSIIRLKNGELVSCGVDNTIKFWQENHDVFQSRLVIRLAPIHGQAVSCSTLTIEGFLATGSFDGMVNVWQPDLGENMSRMAFQQPVHAITTLPNGWLACSCHDNTIRVCDLRIIHVIGVLRGHSGFIYGLLVLNDGNLVSTSFDKTLRIWDPIKGLLLRTLVGHTDFVRPLVQLSNGLIASGSVDNTVKIWDTKSGKLKRTLIGHKDAVSGLAVLPSGKLASTSIDHMILLWDTPI